MIEVDVRQCTAEDLEKLIARDPDGPGAQFERERFAAQERGECALLLGWHGDTIHGRVRLRFFSKYIEVLDAFGEFPEINALDAWPTGEGVGTQIIAACEEFSAKRGETQVGIAVVVTNVDARRLYERLGYEYWGDVIDRSEYFDDAGNLVHVQEDPSVYLIKNIA